MSPDGIFVTRGSGVSARQAIASQMPKTKGAIAASRERSGQTRRCVRPESQKGVDRYLQHAAKSNKTDTLLLEVKFFLQLHRPQQYGSTRCHQRRAGPVRSQAQHRSRRAGLSRIAALHSKGSDSKADGGRGRRERT